MISKICNAISRKKIIEFYYDGGNRIVEPFCYGIHKDTNNEILRGYQIRGFNSSGNLPNWRIFDVSKIRNINITVEVFDGKRFDYRPSDSHMSKIYCNV